MAQWNKVCWNSEGKGRAEVKGNRYLFRYEALLDSKKSLFKMAIRLPVGGEEMIEMDFSGSKAKVSGRFYKRLMRGLKDRKNRSLLNAFILKWAQILATVGRDGEIPGHDWKMRDDHFLIPMKVGKKGEFLFDAYDHDQFYRRMILSLVTSKNAEPSVKIHLFPSECF